MAYGSRKKVPKLQGYHFYKRELCLYFGVYFAYLIYGLWILFDLRKVLQQRSGFTRDPFNYELDIFNNYVRSNWHWYIVHAIIATGSKFFFNRDNIGLAFACVSIPSLLSTLQFRMNIFLGTMLLIFYLVSYIGNRKLIWFATALWVAVLNILALNIGNFSDEQDIFYTFSVILFWTLLRCCSFAHFWADIKKVDLLKLSTVTHYLGYTLYFPTLVNGPFLDYKRYIVILKKKDAYTFFNEVKYFAYEIVRIFFWWLVLELGMRYLFVHYMAVETDKAKLVRSPFGRHAIGYFLGLSFFMTYFVKYGLGIASSRYDGMHPPSKPQCIGHVHYYSNMWKHFDQGLYEFLFDYIYQPLVNANYSKFVSTVLTFAFVFMWHGCQTEILIWTVMNFWCLIFEKLLKHAMRSTFYKSCIEQNLGKQLSQRFHAIIFSQLFIVAAFANVFFIGSPEMGVFLILNAYRNGFANYLALSFCCYCFFQCSELISMKLWKENVKWKRKAKSN
ncbi:protein-cysteine N-palmitoyltransferase Rasp [Bactrocera oleae]|uniref:protein-cysteine N-palmitoyltransferase Rasp n=1 Tax=Bactrocera oleae TaxID=104688 RepID=UPI0006B6E7F0|nr:protein-cysteine N-palmitoyltransferase Rasp [Bactrocera oleae]XP_036216294.1 protein-cysteine N-palmitoyltransferase Rasp [Bactrocera oleae]